MTIVSVSSDRGGSTRPVRAPMGCAAGPARCSGLSRGARRAGRAPAIRLSALLLSLLLSACGYNTIQTLDEQAEASRNQIEVQLQRRADLVPNLVATVKGYAQQELTIFTEVARARAGLAGAVQTGDPGEMAAANDRLTGALGRLLAIAEAYPQLKSDQNFIRLQDELAGTENRIAVARSDYNEAAREYNTYVRRFPQVLTAKVIGADQREYFEAEAGSREAPTVDFSTPAAGAGGTGGPAPSPGPPPPPAPAPADTAR